MRTGFYFDQHWGDGTNYWYTHGAGVWRTIKVAKCCLQMMAARAKIPGRPVLIFEHWHMHADSEARLADSYVRQSKFTLSCIQICLGTLFSSNLSWHRNQRCLEPGNEASTATPSCNLCTCFSGAGNDTQDIPECLAHSSACHSDPTVWNSILTKSE